MSYSIKASDFNNGAVQQTEANNIRVSMHHEGGVYHVGAYCGTDNKWIKARCFHTLTEARKVYSRYVRIAKL
jgi:hypothetical protein